MYSKITNHIEVSVVPEPIEDESDPTAGVFAFAYTIKIKNLGAAKVQLLERHWIIHSGGKHFNEVIGPGVVGKQPVLGQGAEFSYTSGAVIKDPVGSMKGTYTMKTTEGEVFQVEIPQFDLRYPIVFH